MNLAQLVKSQTLATLLQALDAAGELTAGRTVQARLASLEPDGTATAMIGESKVALVLAGPQAKQVALQPGATLLLRLDPPEQPDGDLRATLVEVRPPSASTAGQAQPQTVPASQPAQPATPPASTAAPARPAPAAGPTPAPQPVATPAPTTAQAAHPPSPVAVQQAFLQQALQTLGLSAAQPAATSPIATGATPANAAAPNASSPTAAAPLAAALLAAPVMTAATARAVAGPLLGPMLQNQASLAPLFANLRAIAQGSISLALPKTLPPAIQQILAQAIPAERQAPTAARLKEAFQASGLFLDARQAATLPAPRQGDLKANLQALRETLLPIIDALSPDPKASRHDHGNDQAADQAGSATTDPSTRLAPPRRDGPLAPQPAVEPSLIPGEKPLAIAEALLDQTDAALDRIKLTQYASLPLEPARQDGTQPAQRWLAEIPLAFQQGIAMLPLQVERDAPRRDAQGVSPPLWRIRFALDVEPMGPLQGVVTLQGRDVGVSIWAEREETSQLLRGAAPGLEGALLDADFASGAIDIHTGQPRVMQPTAGQFLDRLS